MQVYLALSLVMFLIGALGFLFRKNVVVLFMCVELMLNAANIAIAVFSRAYLDVDGQVAALFVMAVAAAEAAIGLAVIIAFFRSTKSLDSSDAALMRR